MDDEVILKPPPIKDLDAEMDRNNPVKNQRNNIRLSINNNNDEFDF